MKFVLAKTALISVMLLAPGLFCAIDAKTIQNSNEPEAYLRIDAGSPAIFIEVYMKQPLAAGADVGAIRASLRDTVHKRLLSVTISPSPEGNSNFRIQLNESEADIVDHFQDFVVFVDAYPISGGSLNDQFAVSKEVSWELENNPNCPLPELLQITVTRKSNHAYAISRMDDVKAALNMPNAKSFIVAEINQDGNLEPRTVAGFGPVNPNTDALGTSELFVCVTFNKPPPAGVSEIQMHFVSPMPLELRAQGTFEFTTAANPKPRNEERNAQDFFDLGLTLTSSVTNETQDDDTVRRVRTTRGALDLFVAPILNKRMVGTSGAAGFVQVYTPFYIDAKVATGKITGDTLALNTINIGSLYEFRHYLNTKAYPDLLRHALTVKHTSDRDFKQDEFKFTYEFQPIFGAVNKPIGSAPNLLKGEVQADKKDKFGMEMIPVVGVELGRTYRVRDPKEFEGISRNLRRFYFGADLTFDFTRFVRMALSDRFYVNGENPNNRTRNYFLGTLELPLSGIDTSRVRAGHAFYMSFERGDQPPFTDPSVNVFKIGYRIRARGLFNR